MSFLASFRRHRFVGHVEAPIGGRVSGWIVDRECPRSRVLVYFGPKQTLGGIALADRYRADVQATGHSVDGFCGFTVEAGAANAVVHIKLSPAHRTVAVELGPAERPMYRLRCGSRVYGAERGRDWISGFALDLDRPLDRCILQLQRADGSTGRLAACRFDPRARPTHAHDGFYGFRTPAAGGGRIVDADTGALVYAWNR